MDSDLAPAANLGEAEFRSEIKIHPRRDPLASDLLPWGNSTGLRAYWKHGEVDHRRTRTRIKAYSKRRL